MKPSLCATLALLAVACTSPNPDYAPAGGVPDGSAMSGSDGGVRSDLGSSTSGDLSMLCTAGERLCLASSGSGACVDGQPMLDRKCPDASMCLAGYCQPPPMNSTTMVGTACDGSGGPQENICFTDTTSLSCQPFVTDGKTMTVSWFCDKAVGGGRPGDMCMNGSECRSGFCGSNGTCYRACLDATDCPIDPTSGTNFRCESVSITVEGVMVSAKSCIP